MRSTYVPIIAAFLAFTSASSAVSAGEYYTNFIQGTCGDFIKASPVDRQFQEARMFGYITAANIYKSRETVRSARSYSVWIEEYCKQNPFDSFANALVQLDASLGPGTYKKQ